MELAPQMQSQNLPCRAKPGGLPGRSVGGCALNKCHHIAISKTLEAKTHEAFPQKWGCPRFACVILLNTQSDTRSQEMKWNLLY